jgi:hypothetical protein
MPTAEDLLDRYSGQIVPFSFNAGFVGLSYVVSLVGAGSTLELINRRTSHKGYHNQFGAYFLKTSGELADTGRLAFCSSALPY